MKPWTWRGAPIAIAFVLASLVSTLLDAAPLRMTQRSRKPVDGRTNEWRVVESQVEWEASRTAVVVCDMWDKHWCPDATERVGELAPVMNRVIQAARDRGATIIHCPSDTMKFYTDHPGRKLALAAPKVETVIPLQGWCSLQGHREPALPIDDSDGGCDGCPDCSGYTAWSRQHPAIEIRDGDAITDSVEAFYLMRQRGLTNVIVMGVHENMCVLGRPFSIRQMVAQGQNVVLMRDMTDSMYHHRKRPYVSHFVGTDLVCEHIEKYWCASVTSSDFIGGKPFRFKEDRRKTVALILGENEYDTAETLPRFFKEELEWRGYQLEKIEASAKEGDTAFQNISALARADLALVSVRRRTPPKELIAALRAHVAAGKPVVGIRTASHAFDAKPANDGLDAWPLFDDEVLGADYQGHYGNKPPAAPATQVWLVRSNAAHPVLKGVAPAEFESTSHLYKYRKLGLDVTPLLAGRVGGRDEVETVAWVNEAEGRRVFYTSMGNPADFRLPAFRRLLLNGILWSLGDYVPPADAAAAAAPAQKAAASPARPEANVPKTARPAPAAAAATLDLPQETSAPALTPEEALKQFRVADDLEWEQVLAEPVITQPVFLNFDERGRMWVVEYRQYPMPAGLKLVSRDSVWRNVYDKVPPPPPNHFRGADQISIHEDADGDGRYESHKVFIDGLNIVTSVERGRGGVWVMNPPYLLFYADRNGDDRPDGDPEVRLSGFGLEDTHSVANSIRWGPDGWLYGAQGSTVTANILVYGADGKPKNAKPLYSQGQNIWRYHPERRVYEVFSEGGGNAFGCELDSQGRIFSGHNGGDTRGFHYVQGAYLQKGFEKHGPLSNPYAYGYFPAMGHAPTPRFTHNFVIYEGGAFPASYDGHLFGVEPIQGRVVEAERIVDGSTFRTRDLGRPVISEDRWFRPVDIKIGPDGALYVADWYDQQVNHFRNHEGKMDAKNGRVYRLKAKGRAPIAYSDLGAMRTEQLVGLLKSRNRWMRQTALRLLHDRRDAGAVDLIRRQMDESVGQLALESFWAVAASGGWNEATAIAATRSIDAQVRAWAVRMAGDAGEVSGAMAERLAELAKIEPGLEARVQLAATARRLPAAHCLPILRGLLGFAGDANDPRQPLLIWWAVESKCASDREAVVRFFSDKEVWTSAITRQFLAERVARRYAQAGTQRDWLTVVDLLNAAPDVEGRRRMVAGVEAAVRGRSLAGLPGEALEALARVRSSSPALGVRRGDPTSISRALAAIADESVARADRMELLAVLAEVKIPNGADALIQIFRGAVGDDGIRKATMVAMQRYDDLAVADAVVGLYAKLGKDSLPTAQSLLSSRETWARYWVRAMDRKASSWSGPLIRPETVPAAVVRKLKQHREVEVREMAERLWPGLGVATTAAMETRIRELGSVVRGGTGDPYDGRTLFQAQCGTCHRLFAQGADVGPDLTVYQRNDLDSMLLSIVNPSAEVREGYEHYSVEIKDGRSLAGFVVEQDDRMVVLRGLDGDNHVLRRDELSELKAAGTSLMPEGLLDGMNEQQVRDLFAYLRSTQPLVGESPRKAAKAAKP